MGRRTRTLLEQVASPGPLKVDRDNCIVYRVRVLGRYSRNPHGLKQASNGTDYGPCMEKAIPMYEGVGVMVNHPKAGEARKTRPAEDGLGTLKNVRLEGEALWADLHCIPEHDMTPRVLSDAGRGVGLYGLSHNASSLAESMDHAAKRLVIEELEEVRSVDLVLRPGANRTLWESLHVKKTLREIIEGLELTPVREKRRKVLLEDDGMAPAMDAPVDAPDSSSDEDALWTGFAGAIQAICDQYKAGELSAKDAGKKVVQYLKAHEGLSDDAEPAADDEPKDPPSDEDKTEAVKENAVLKHKLAVRELCEELGVTADKTLLESVEALPIANARKLLEREKSRGTGSGKPRGAGFTPGSTGKPAKKTGKTFLDRVTE